MTTTIVLREPKCVTVIHKLSMKKAEYTIPCGVEIIDMTYSWLWRQVTCESCIKKRRGKYEYRNEKKPLPI